MVVSSTCVFLFLSCDTDVVSFLTVCFMLVCSLIHRCKSHLWNLQEYYLVYRTDFLSKINWSVILHSREFEFFSWVNFRKLAVEKYGKSCFQKYTRVRRLWSLKQWKFNEKWSSDEKVYLFSMFKNKVETNNYTVIDFW